MLHSKKRQSNNLKLLEEQTSLPTHVLDAVETVYHSLEDLSFNRRCLLRCNKSCQACLILVLVFGFLFFFGAFIFATILEETNKYIEGPSINTVEFEELVDTKMAHVIKMFDNVEIIPQNDNTSSFSDTHHHYPGYYSSHILSNLPETKTGLFLIKIVDEEGKLIEVEAEWTKRRSLVYGFTGEMFIWQIPLMLCLLTSEFNGGGIYDENGKLISWIDPNKVEKHGNKTLFPVPSFSSTTLSGRIVCGEVVDKGRQTKLMVYGEEQFDTKQALVAYIKERKMKTLLPNFTYKVIIWHGDNDKVRTRIIQVDGVGIAINDVYIPKEFTAKGEGVGTVVVAGSK